MKKNNVISMIIAALLALCVLVCFTGCPHPDGTGTGGGSGTGTGGGSGTGTGGGSGTGTGGGSGTGTGGGSGTGTGGGSGTGTGGGTNALQAQIDAAAAGSTVTLLASNEGTAITISKALTVNGSGIEDLVITVAADVANDVTLSNFVNATVTVTGSAGRMARSVFAARDAGGNDDEPVGPKELGDDNPKLRLENCSFEEFTIDENVTLFLDRDENKVTIDELKLKNGLEQFVLIGNDEETDPEDKKSLIEKLYVEAGVEEINLVGGYFDDLEFTGDFSDKVDFYYDKNGEQAAADFKARLAEAEAQAEAMDVCAVRNGTGVYKVTVPKAKIEAAQGTMPYAEALSGSILIMLLTDEQREAYLASIPENTEDWNLYIIPEDDEGNELGWKWATIDQPYFDVCYTGGYLFDTENDGLRAVSGDVSQIAHLIDGEFDYEYFDYYRSYSTDALCSQCSGDYITIYLDVSKLRKSDLDTCAYKADGQTDEYYMTPNKLTEIDLTGYKPYIALDYSIYNALRYPMNPTSPNEESLAEAKEFFGEALNDKQIQTPISKFNPSGGHYVFMFPMDEAESYPDGAAEWEQIPCPEPPQND